MKSKTDTDDKNSKLSTELNYKGQDEVIILIQDKIHVYYICLHELLWKRQPICEMESNGMFCYFLIQFLLPIKTLTTNNNRKFHINIIYIYIYIKCLKALA